MKMEHCHKCKKQIEVPKSRKEITNYSSSPTKFKENNEVSFAPREKTASIHTNHYCNNCYYEILDLLQSKGFITGEECQEFYSD